MNLDQNDLLDSTLDDLADLPETKAFPPGVHEVDMFLSAPKPKPGKNQQVICKFKYVNVVELVDPDVVPPNENDECSIFVSLKKKDGTKNEFGEGQLKQLLAPLAAAGLTGSPRELIEQTKDGVRMIIVTTTKDYQGNAQLVLNKIDVAE